MAVEAEVRRLLANSPEAREVARALFISCAGRIREALPPSDAVEELARSWEACAMMAVACAPAGDA